jgi:hypothetical protein
LPAPGRPECRHFLRGFFCAVRFEKYILAVLPHFTGCRIETKCDVIARTVTSFGDRFENNFYRFFVRFEVWRKSTFVTNSGVVASLSQYAAKRVEGLHAHANRFSE